MDVFNTRYKNIVNEYFEIMSKENRITNKQRVTSVEQLKQEFLNNCYSPTYNNMHVLFLGLLNDAIYMLNKQTSQNKTNFTKLVVNKEQKKETVVSSKNQKPISINVKEKLKIFNLTKSDPQFSDIMPKQPITVLRSFLRGKKK